MTTIAQCACGIAAADCEYHGPTAARPNGPTVWPPRFGSQDHYVGEVVIDEDGVLCQIADVVRGPAGEIVGYRFTPHWTALKTIELKGFGGC